MPYPIFPANHGGARRLSNLIRRLSEGCDLYLIVFIRTKDDPLQREALEPFVEKLWFHHWHPAIDKRKDLRPPNVRLFEDPAASLLIRDVVETHRIDVVQLEYTEMAQYRHAVGDVPVILVEHDVAFRSLRRRRSLGFGQRFPESRAFGASWLDWMALMRYEVRACRSVDQLHMMSADDAGYLARFLQDGARRMYVVPNAVDTEHYRPTDSMPKRMGVLMVGNYQNLPNLDAFEYLVEEIWPRVRELRPDAELSVVGAKMPDHLHDWDGKDGVTVVGEVESIRAEYHKHAVLVVPLRAGSGTRLKLFEAFASGIPSVSTTIGAEGIACRHDEHVLIADDAASIAREIDRLLGDQELADRVADNALRLVEERYDWSAAAAVNLSGVHELMRPEPAPQVAATPITDPEPRPFGRSPAGAIAVSVIIPTYRGGELLERCLEGISRQQCSRPFEVVCVDSGSPESDLGVMRRLGARVHGIDKRFFNHGLTRDLGARLAAGEVLVYINQDVIAADDSWLEEITKPLFAEDPPAAVQGAMAEFPHHTSPVRRFFWDSCGERFYFTRESDRWIRRFEGVGFSTVNAALRRDAWEQIPFGWAPFMEDKKWQRQAMQAGLKIVDAHKARVYHTHDYDVRSLLRRCQSEGFGWRLLGEHYTFGDMLRDLWAPRQWKELLRGLIRQGREMKTAEIFFPWLRPVAVWYGNKRLQDVKH